MNESSQDTRGGLLYGLAAYGLWGLVPLYFGFVRAVAPLEILAHRIVWSVVVLAILLTLSGRWLDLQLTLRSGRTVRLLLASALLVSTNWLVYIYGVATSRIVETSLGYFINPLVSVMFGLVFFRERLRWGQWLALVLAVAGIAHLVLRVGELPWIALVLACSFGLYGLVRKVTPVDGLIGLSIETMLLAPLALVGLGVGVASGATTFANNDRATDGLLALSGVVTTLPLLCFGQAARRLRLSTLGFLQYLAPSIQFLIAVLLFEEPFRPAQQVTFGLIWAALAIFSLDALLEQRQKATSPRRPRELPSLTLRAGEESGC